MPSNEINFGGVAYGIVGRTQLKPLGLPELGKASLLIRSFPVEKSVIADDERRNQKRWFTDSTLKAIAELIATDLQAAVTTRFLLRALKIARPEAFPLEIQSAGTASEAGQLSGKNMSPTNVVWEGDDGPRSLEIEVMAEEISARIVSQLDAIDGRMTVALALQSLGKTLRTIGTRWNISGQYVGQLISRAHEVVREEYKRMTTNLQLNEPEIAQMQASVIGLVLASCRQSVGDVDAD